MSSNNVHIVYRGFSGSTAVTRHILSRVEKMYRVCDRITSCRVAVEKPHLHHHKGQSWQVTVDLAVPDDQIVVCKGRGNDRAHEKLQLALRDAFEAAEKQLQTRMQRRRRLRRGSRNSPAPIAEAPLDESLQGEPILA